MKAALPLLALLISLQGAAAQESVALSVEGWRTETRNDVIYYRCASQICAAGSVVSYKAQPHRTSITLADFEKHHRGLAEQNKGQGRIRDVRIADVKQRTVDGVRVLQISREVDWADNTTTYTIEARLIGLGQELQPRQQLSEARMDRQQLRGLPASPRQHRGYQGAVVLNPLHARGLHGLAPALRSPRRGTRRIPSA